MMKRQQDIPRNWVNVAVSDIGETVTGNTPPKNDANNYGDCIPFVKPPELTHCVINTAANNLSEIGKEKSRVLPAYSVLVSCIGNLGKTAINNVPVAFNQQINAIVPSSGIETRFVFYQAQSLIFRKQLEEFSSATTIAIINKGNFQKIRFLLPPSNEQKRIVTKIEELFSELDKGVESLKSARTQLKIYRQSVLKHAFEGKLTAEWRKDNKDKLETADELLERIQKEREARHQQQLEEWEASIITWEKSGKEGKKPPKPRQPVLAGKSTITEELKKHCIDQWAWLSLSDISDISGGLTKNPKRNSLQKKMKYLRVANVYADELLLDTITEIGVTEAEFKKLELIAGDLLVVEGNGSIDQIGRLAVWTGEIDQIGHQNHLIRVRLVDGMLPRFFLLFLLSPLGRKFIVRQASSTSGLHTLSISKVSGLPIPVPNLCEQNTILTEVDSILSQIDKMETAIENEDKRSAALRQSILKKAFSGKLVAQDHNDEPASVLLERIKAEKNANKKKGKAA